MGRTIRPGTALLVLILLFTALSFARHGYGHSPDLMATWLAGHFYGQGATDQVYAGYDGLFTMLPPSEWWSYLVKQGRTEAVYPYVYPPLWAALASHLTPWIGIDGFQVAASLVNPVLLALMVLLAGRACGQAGWALVRFVALGLGLMIFTLPGLVALAQNQPQILVSLLIVGAIERDRAGAGPTAGALLALAAAIKLYPAVLALLWLAGRRWRSLTAFVLVGGALGGLSLLLAGWPLHAQFLNDVAAIRQTVLMNHFTYGLDPVIAQLAPVGEVMIVTAPESAASPSNPVGWRVLEKPPLWSGLSTLALLALVAFGGWRCRRRVDVLFWPVFLVALALILPLSWGYHYLPALAFLPVLPIRYGLRCGTALFLALALPLTVPAYRLIRDLPLTDMAPQIAGTAIMIACGIALALAPRGRRG
jgi:hypothetical protein